MDLRGERRRGERRRGERRRGERRRGERRRGEHATLRGDNILWRTTTGRTTTSHGRVYNNVLWHFLFIDDKKLII